MKLNKTNIISVCASLTLSYMALLPQFYLIYDAVNRYHLLWDRAYHAAILSALIILCVPFLVLMNMEAWFRNRQVKGVVCWLASVFSFYVVLRMIIAMLDRTGNLPPFFKSTNSKLLVYFAVPAVISIFRPIAQFEKMRCGLAYLVVAPLFLFFGPLTYRVYEKGDMEGLSDLVRAEDIAEPKQANRERSIFIFIFDEWDFQRVFGGTVGIDVMPRLKKRLSYEGITYTQAYSAGALTISSMPRMLLPFSPLVEGKRLQDIKHAVISGTLRADADSIYDVLPGSQLNIMSGFGMNYTRLLGSSVDYSISYRDAEGYFRTYRSELWRLLMSQVDWLRFFGIRVSGVEPLGGIVALQKVHKDAIFAMTGLRRPVFAIFHYCLPRYPYVWSEDGLKNTMPSDVRAPTVDNYMNNVAYLDRIVDEIIDIYYEVRGKDDLMIMTSDHGWRYDPERGWPQREFPSEKVDANTFASVRHVPLVVFGGAENRTKGIVDERFVLTDLYRLLDKY